MRLKFIHATDFKYAMTSAMGKTKTGISKVY